jgi:hypothetical protein
MKPRRFSAVLLTLILFMACLTSSCSNTDADVANLLGNLKLPPKARNTQWNAKLENDVLKFDARYNGVTLPLLIDFMRSLEDGNWYLEDDRAYRGNRSLGMTYDFETQRLLLSFVQNVKQPQWPDVLPATLSHLTPVFPFGVFSRHEKLEIVNAENAYMLEFDNVTDLNVTVYEKSLAQGDYAFVSEQNGQRHFQKQTLFVSIAYNANAKSVQLIVGNDRTYFVPLPPWPDPLPENVKRSLAPVAALCKAEALLQGYRASAENLSLRELFGFFKSLTAAYGWSMPNDGGKMVNTRLSYSLQVVSFNTIGHKLTFDLMTTGDFTPSPEASLSPTPASTMTNGVFDDGLPDYDFRLTSGKYTETEAAGGVQSEFGQIATQADWEEVKLLYASRISPFLTHVGVNPNEDVWILYKKSGFDGNRHYFLARIAGIARPNFQKYDGIGSEAWLGSWSGIKLRVLVKVPVK